MKLNKEDRSLTTTDRENITLLSKYFHRICNREILTDCNFINTVPHYKTLHKIGIVIQLEELNVIVKHLK